MSTPLIDAQHPSDDDARRHVVLVNDRHRWLFRYSAGEEARLLDDLAAMADDPQSELTWFDAAVLSHEMGQRLGQQLEQILK